MPGLRPTPHHEAINMDVRAQLMSAINEQIVNNGWTQSEAAEKLNVNQPRISYLVSGQIERFSVDALLNMAALAGLQIELTVKPATQHQP
ncbi:helix-turn-helix domain-containing protein [Mycobacterium sp. shizuoka-1]|uniref:helix-turn-helix domain-containing protein n=1 Tax=Mycobacterium sp. shizuoka-1 TaxID=2039281 RepID=UPI000C060D60|nr:helix-turn-helix transcriptional regulator [Mycobacterium sp. shizuoka-1]GAY17629.1 hypothetical protein MSZK_43550 [Mycobacterium sp. shizuoka-1]